MSFCAPFQASCPLIHAGPWPVSAPNLRCRWPARSCWLRTRWRGSRNSAGSLCMVGRSGSLGMMGRQLAVRCTKGTCDHAREVEGSWRACHSLNKEVWDTGYTACPCALCARWAASDGTAQSTRCRRSNLTPKLQICCLRWCAGWKGGKSRWTAGCVEASLARGVLLVPGRGSGSLYRDAPCRHGSLVWCPRGMTEWPIRSFHPEMNLKQTRIYIIIITGLIDNNYIQYAKGKQSRRLLLYGHKAPRAKKKSVARNSRNPVSNNTDTV